MRNLDIKIKYKSFNDDIIDDFYTPVLNKTQRYYRAVGYFSSNILINYAKGLINLIKNEGQIKLLISPYLTESDLKELNSLEEDNSRVLDEIFLNFINGDVKALAASKLMVALVNKGFLEIKVATPKNTLGLFHEKIGIFIDKEGNKIAIIGSNNETKSAVDSNQESFNTFCSWKEGQSDYVDQHLKDFEDYWNGNNANIDIHNLKEAISDSILKKIDTDESIEDLFDIILKEDKIPYNLGFTPYDFQKSAVEKWLNKRQGIFKFATGAGKTKTAIYLMEKLKETNNKLLFVIVVPDKTLVNQWNEELEKYQNKIIKCYLSSQLWKKELREIIDIFDVFDQRHQVILATNSTFFDKTFQKEFSLFKEEYVLIVDECHSWGTNRILNKLPQTPNKLGLSATPELFFSKEKTNKLMNYFGGIIYEYSLKDAIKDGRLVEYYYHPIEVSLTDEERNTYKELTKKIVKILGHDSIDIKDGYDKALEMLLFKRAKIVYGAKNKINVLEKLLDNLNDKNNLLIYCGATSYKNELDGEIETQSITQLELVNSILYKKKIKSAQYTSKENEYERKQAIDLFKKQSYSTLVAIKCLDEGVDIPQIENAIILASSTNPREFIQRRGRILRTYPGKKFASIYDFIVIDYEFDSLIKKELQRLNEFASIAINANEIYEKYKNKIDTYILEGDIDG